MSVFFCFLKSTRVADLLNYAFYKMFMKICPFVVLQVENIFSVFSEFYSKFQPPNCETFALTGAAAEVGDGAQRGGSQQRQAAEEPPGAHRVHAHAENHSHLHTQPLQSECAHTCQIPTVCLSCTRGKDASSHAVSSLLFFLSLTCLISRDSSSGTRTEQLMTQCQQSCEKMLHFIIIIPTIVVLLLLDNNNFMNNTNYYFCVYCFE